MKNWKTVKLFSKPKPFIYRCSLCGIGIGLSLSHSPLKTASIECAICKKITTHHLIVGKDQGSL